MAPQARPAGSDDRAWEREFAPKISRGRVAIAAIIFALWLSFLLYWAVQRWMSLQ